MKINLSRTLLLLLITVWPSYGRTSDPVFHTAGQILFEIVENGAVSKKRVSLDLRAGKKDGNQWAECLITIITRDDKNKRMEFNAYYASTDQATIRNLNISPKAVSFDMMPFPLAPDRPLKFVATREHEASYVYQANAVGLWKGKFKEAELVKTEWRQVQSIALPFSTIGK